jgi:PmbA protein
MLNLAERTVRSALKNGAQEAEAYVYQGFTTNVGIERGQIVRSARIIDQGIGIRTIINRTTGFAYTNTLDNPNSIEQIIQKALNYAKASKPDPDWKQLPDKKTHANPKDTFDPAVAKLRSEDLVKTASTMLDAAQSVDKKVSAVEGGAGASHLMEAIANSNGIADTDQATIVECSMATIAREGNEVTPGCFEFNAERSLNIDPQWVGKEAAKIALSALKPKKTESKPTTIIFTQLALQQLLYFTVMNALRADFVQRNQSAFKDKLGQKVASDIVTIHDDGLLQGGLRTGKIDGEGVPQQKTPLIEKGTLQSFIYDNYTARKENRQSTGNASRAGYLSTPNVDSTNFHVMPGNTSKDNLLNEVKDGVLVSYLQGAHSSNPASGEFSIVATPAWKIKNGETTHAIKGMMVAGNMFQVLKDISAIANNERKLGQLVSPWIAVQNVKVIGK